MLEKFAEFVAEINRTTSRLDKEASIKKYAEEEEVTSLLQFIYSPYVITGVSAKKLKKAEGLTANPKAIMNTYKDLIDYFSAHNTGTDSDLCVLKSWLDTYPDKADLIKEIIAKSLKLGIQPKTINKVFGYNFIPQFSVMLAEKYFDDPNRYLPIGTRFILSIKLDGVRCVCVKKKGCKPAFFSRQGQPFLGMVDLEEEVNRCIPDNTVIDGELLIDNTEDLLSKDLYRATVKVVNSDMPVKKNVTFNTFDILSVEDFTNGICKKVSLDRKKELHNIYINNKTNWLREVVNLYEGTEQSQIAHWLDRITSNGGEGVMINLADAPYECKRTRNLLKVKKMQTMDLRCVGVEEGTGANAGKLGAINVEFPAPDGNTYIVAVGSGFTSEERDAFWSDNNKVVGKIVEVQYFEVSQNQQGGYSLRFPVFKWVREDKNEVSIY